MRLDLSKYMGGKEIDIEADLVVSCLVREADIINKDAKPILTMDGKEQLPTKKRWYVDLLTPCPVPISIPFESLGDARKFKRDFFPIDME